MILRSDHVAGAAFVAFGALVIALSGDLPTGQLSMPGSGFLPKLVSSLTIVFGLALIARAKESPPFSELTWTDASHAGMVVVVTAGAVALYTVIGFVLTMIAMMTVALVAIERRNVLIAFAYSAGIVLVTYAGFVYLLRTPLPEAPFGF